MCPSIIFPQVKEFVITQHPTAETRDAFWTMLWDHNAQTVVLLTPLTQTTAVFWPVKHEEYDLDYFKVCRTLLMAKRFYKNVAQVRFIESTVHEGHTTLDFVISSRYDDYELKVSKPEHSYSDVPMKSKTPNSSVPDLVLLRFG